ncbi:MAG: potassium-transporting ATPase subunit KdpC [Verrucomicrobiota bacterium]|nr:potassium-transporting ATPase subunit KdpC [Verrucomicrobiota bacterium]
MIRVAFLLFLSFSLLFGFVYPFLVWGIGQLFFPEQAKGSLVRDAEGMVLGSTLIGQNFQDPRYFHPRPSAAGKEGYDASHSSGSNFGPTSEVWLKLVSKRAEEYRLLNKLEAQAAVPAEAVTASGSGLDPHISLDCAKEQILRIAELRHVSSEQVERILDAHTEEWFGEKYVNVLRLNLALDMLTHGNSAIEGNARGAW